ncbi:UNVERIFIED_CONTAM: hypothetical protein GTU68_028826, partial [Idotea baltica]|nr:hypothetical protein [Idotea baltica]
GLTIPDGTEGVPCDDGDECLDYGVAKVIVTYEGNCETVQWTSAELEELKDCLSLIGHWYGGGQQFTEPWPMESNPRIETAYVTSDMLARVWTYGGVSESYWISSAGISAKVDNTVPLFLSIPDTDGDGTADEMCFSAKYNEPYVAEASNSTLQLLYTLCYADDIRQVYESTFPKYFPYPRDIPDQRMFTHPIWSTWAEYESDVNDSRVLDLAQTIIDQGFNNSQIEIDDNWETCYGDAEFNPDRFPDPKVMVDSLHAMGYRVTLWIHPFINDDCQSYDYADQNGFFLKNETGQTQKTSWWDGRSSGLIDFTNNEALTWWSLRLANLKAQTGIDSFKFDAGETSWMPDVYTLSINKSYWPNGYTTS